MELCIVQPVGSLLGGPGGGVLTSHCSSLNDFIQGKMQHSYTITVFMFVVVVNKELM